MDLRFDDKTHRELARSKQKPVSYQEGYTMAEKIGAFAYMECSAKLNEGIREVKEIVARVSLLSQKALRNAMGISMEHRLQLLKEHPQRFRKLITLS